MTDASTEVHALGKRVVAIADLELRRDFVFSLLRGANDAEVADLMTLAASGAESNLPSYRAVFLALTSSLSSPELRERGPAFARAAAAKGQHATALFFANGAAKELEDSPHVPQLNRERPLTLGERKSLARGRDRTLLTRIIADPHPDVVAIVLRNPALVESDVVRLCATRPLLTDVLHQVVCRLKWLSRPSVQRAIVHNPYSPVGLSMQLLPHLRSQDLREVGASLAVAPPIRSAARRRASIPPRH